MIDAWSMRNWRLGHESGHDHFFASFSKFGLATRKHIADAITAAIEHAAADHLEYIELMYTLAGSRRPNSGHGWVGILTLLPCVSNCLVAESKK